MHRLTGVTVIGSALLLACSASRDGTDQCQGQALGATSQLVAATLGHASPAITEAAYIDHGRAQAAQHRTALRVLEGGRR